MVKKMCCLTIDQSQQWSLLLPKGAHTSVLILFSNTLFPQNEKKL